MSPKLISSPCAKHDRCDPSLLEFLLITDQKDSSEIPHHEIKQKTERHFNEFIPALPKTATVVKNIGDSLMVHVALKTAELPAFLSKILQKKADLNTISETSDNEASRQLKVPIRIVMIYLDPKEFLHGKNIDWLLQQEHYEAEVPAPRAKKCASWLCGDLFGSNIALAFRASSVPKDDIVVIDDRIVKKWRDKDDSDAFEDGQGLEVLRFGPKLAFSPFKGLEDIYRFGGEGPVSGSSWESHLFLRMVGRVGDKVEFAPDNKLVLDQQKVRIFTEIVWIGKKAPIKECNALLGSLNEKQKGANYIRNFGRVIESEDFPDDSLSHDVGVILMGAYPNSDSYAEIRRELDSIRDKSIAKYAYPVTNEVYASPQEMLNAFWVPDMLSSKYLLLFARWKPVDRRNDAQNAENRLNIAIRDTSFDRQISVARCGLIQGNLWDVYALFSFLDLETTFGQAELNVLTNNIKEQGFAAATLKLCVTCDEKEGNQDESPHPNSFSATA